jgi:hypothetical protein
LKSTILPSRRLVIDKGDGYMAYVTLSSDAGFDSQIAALARRRQL